MSPFNINHINQNFILNFEVLNIILITYINISNLIRKIWHFQFSSTKSVKIIHTRLVLQNTFLIKECLWCVMNRQPASGNT